MNSISQLYDFLAGPCLYVTAFICLAGLTRKTMVILSGRFMGLRFPARYNDGNMTGLLHGADAASAVARFVRRDPFLAFTGTLFHISIFAAPLSARAHYILLDLSWRVFPPRIDPSVTSLFTATALITGLALILRRTFVSHVWAVSSWRDYAAMTCALSPFLTGLLAGVTAGVTYQAVMLVHVASAHILLMALGWTGLGHAVFFTAGRLALSGRLSVRAL